MYPPIYIEGLVGAGKSSVIALLKQKNKNSQDLVFCFEPVDQYATFTYKKQHYNPLKLMYEGLDADKFPVQWHICQQSFQYYPRCTDSLGMRIGIFERSMFSNVPFIQAYQNLGFLTDFASVYLYKAIEARTSSSYNCYPGLIIYLNVSVSLALQRIKQRDRVGEHVISEQFLECLKRYQLQQLQLFKKGKARDLPVTVVVIDVDENATLEEIASQCDKIIHGYRNYHMGKQLVSREGFSKHEEQRKKQRFLRRNSLPAKEAQKTYCENVSLYGGSLSVGGSVFG